jgi:precorrin-2 dehydrogenase/sirohydrochlorin ferrochelatase
MKPADIPLFPIFLKLRKRKCVVVGAGKIASAKAAGLLRNQAQVVVIGPRATGWIQNQARAGKLIWHKRNFRAEDVAGAFLVVAATNSSATNEGVFRACTAQGTLCNVVDDPEHCDFYYPAVVHRGPLQIAIATGGRSPALARRLRIELERQFGPEYGAWVEHVGKMRKQILRQSLSAEERRKLMDQISSRESLKRFLKKHASAKSRERQGKSPRSRPPTPRTGAV